MQEQVQDGMGRYIYCIVDNNSQLNIGNIGVEDAEVYTIGYMDIAAVVHACPAMPYKTEDKKKAMEWLFSHGYVIDLLMNRFNSILPFSFDVILKGDDDTVKEWLKSEYDTIKKELRKFREKAEYTIQIFCDEGILAESINNQELKSLKEKIDNLPKGRAYLLQRKFELYKKYAISAEISKLAHKFAMEIEKQVEDMVVEERIRVPESYKDRNGDVIGTMLVITLSCLASRDNDKFQGLSKVLEEISNREGFAVRFTGPWAPFSFVHMQI